MDDGEQKGVISYSEAMQLAENADLDLVEVAPQAKPPVCKIMDYGKYKFEQKKKEKELKKKQNIIHVKELTMGPSIEAHDYDVKLKKALGFLEKGDKIKFTIRFRGRQIVHKDRGREILERFAADLEEVAVLEKRPVMEGRRMFLIVAPKK